MSAKILSLACRAGSIRNQFGVLIEPELDEIGLGSIVARHAMGQLGCVKEDVDRLIFACSGIRPFFPSAAIAIADELGLQCVAFDVTAACASMSIAISSAAAMNGLSLVVGADLLSRTIVSSEPSHLPLQRFADGAAAVIVGQGKSHGPEIVSCYGITHGRWRSYYQANNGVVCIFTNCAQAGSPGMLHQLLGNHNEETHERPEVRWLAASLSQSG